MRRWQDGSGAVVSRHSRGATDLERRESRMGKKKTMKAAEQTNGLELEMRSDEAKNRTSIDGRVHGE